MKSRRPRLIMVTETFVWQTNPNLSLHSTLGNLISISCMEEISVMSNCALICQDARIFVKHFQHQIMWAMLTTIILALSSSCMSLIKVFLVSFFGMLLSLILEEASKLTLEWSFIEPDVLSYAWASCFSLNTIIQTKTDTKCRLIKAK